MMMNEPTRLYFESQAQICAEMGSPFTARVLRAAINVLDGETQTGRRVLDWPGDPRPDAMSLRLAGGLHALVLSGRDAGLAAAYPPNDMGDLEPVLKAAIQRHDAWLSAFLDSPPQTNETGRSAVLLPGFLTIARQTGLPLVLMEIGSSAGLNLFFDRFRYQYGEAVWGDPAYPALLAPQLRGAGPDLSGELKIASRTGCDISPLDVRDENDRLRLRSYIWADQTDRLARLDAAISVARRDGVALERVDAAEFVERRLAARKPGECLVLFHSVVWQYLLQKTKASIEDALHRAGEMATPSAPLAWLRMETLSVTDPYPTLQLTRWPGGAMRHLALADFHGRWLEWLG
jgi:hypothetical protein